VTIKTIFEHQVDALVKDVCRLHQSRGLDQKTYQKIRKQVSGELVNHGGLEIAAAALGGIDDEGACDRLKDIISHCSENFYLEDRVLSAIAVPVGFRMKSSASAALTLVEADANYLSVLEKMATRITNARHVVLGTRLFEGKTLFYCSANKLYQYLRHLEAGSQTTVEVPQPCTVKSDANPSWQMVYLLGVQVTDLNGERDVDTLETHRALGKWTHRAEWALTQNPRVLFTKGISAQAQCHGLHYLGQGLRVGEDIIRGYRLQTALVNFDQGDQGVKFYYVHVWTDFQVLLLVVSHVMTIEIRWKLMGAETLDGFREQLRQAIAVTMPTDTILAMEQVELYDYQKLARENGLSMMLGVM